MSKNITHSFQTISLHEEGNIAYLALNNGKGNTIGSQTLTELALAFEKIVHADAVVFTGNASMFSVGLDLEELIPFSKSEIVNFFDRLHEVRKTLFGLPRPLIVAVSGSAVGAGASFLCCGDIRLGAIDHGRVGFTEAKLHVPLPASARVIASYALAMPDGQHALLFGDTYNKEEGQGLGFFHTLYKPDILIAEASKSAQEAAKISTSAGLIKQSLRQAALQEMETDKKRSHEIFAEAWVGESAQKQIARVMKALSKKRRE